LCYISEISSGFNMAKRIQTVLESRMDVDPVTFLYSMALNISFK
jgi:hypothetical protein